ncbi:MAG: class I SAM-dependent methyltransferase [Nitrospirae bacterium]|nr:class I SAM-dependent methyltransferase [Nitrospirota bacterium]
MKVFEKSFFNYLENNAQKDIANKYSQYGEKEKYLMSNFGREYFDTDLGYNGYYYDGRHEIGVKDMIAYYKLLPGQKVLDVGCAKGFFVYEFYKKGFNVSGCDISSYAISNCKEELKPYLRQMGAEILDYDDNEFELIMSFSVLHNLEGQNLEKALRHIKRCSTNYVYIEVASYTNKFEYKILKQRGITVKTFYSPDEWLSLFGKVDLDCDVFFKTFKS